MAFTWALLKQAGGKWSEDKAPRLGAALAYYSVLSMAPLLVIALALAGLFFGEETVREHLVQQIQGLVGRQGAEAVKTMLEQARKPESGIIASILGVMTLLLGASGVFGELQDALNTIWKVQPKPGMGIKEWIRARFASIAMVLGTGFLLLTSLLLSAALSAFQGYWGVGATGWLFILVHGALSLAVITLLFALIFKFVPDAEVRWTDVWEGAAVTAILFTVGKFLLGLYLGQGSFSSAYGAAGSFVVLVVWVYYSAQILFFGAEMTHVVAQSRHRIAPKEFAEPVAGETSVPARKISR